VEVLAQLLAWWTKADLIEYVVEETESVDDDSFQTICDTRITNIRLVDKAVASYPRRNS